VSSAAATARSAGWADGDTDDSSSSATTGGRRRAEERRRRERDARERVDRSGSKATTDTGSGAGAATESGATKRETTTDGGATDVGDGPGGISDVARSWNASQGYNVRQQYDKGPQRSRLFPTSQSLTLLGIAFVLYPVMLFSAIFPPFPLVVNLVVALCTILLVAYLQSIPEVGVFVFGAWSLATPIAFAIAGVSLTSLVGVVALSATWLPLGLSILTYTAVR